jgi:hypothetical protein
MPLSSYPFRLRKYLDNFSFFRHDHKDNTQHSLAFNKDKIKVKTI